MHTSCASTPCVAPRHCGPTRPCSDLDGFDMSGIVGVTGALLAPTSESPLR
ncbi:hypothetical protein [Actinoplanes subglobosus]|uniref:Uncharacterized protein n=1 Tax=Actinoplanes subglobosus TaxID=1547892 RepID=A0ABV8IKL1_9ACTN